MALVTLPNSVVRRTDRRLAAAARVVQSPFTLSQQVQDWGGRRWEYSLQIGPLQGDEGRAVDAILQGLGGPAARFLYADPSAAYVGSLTLGSPAVNGASQTGSALVTDGWTADITLKAGMMFSLGTDTSTRMYMLTADVVVDGAGNATLAIAPALRASPGDNDPLEVDAPKVQLRLPSAVGAQVTPGAFYSYQVEAVEAL